MLSGILLDFLLGGEFGWTISQLVPTNPNKEKIGAFGAACHWQVAALQVFGRPHFLNQLSIGVTTDGLAYFPSKTYNFPN